MSHITTADIAYADGVKALAGAEEARRLALVAYAAARGFADADTALKAVILAEKHAWTGWGAYPSLSIMRAIDELAAHQSD